ncbi:hypothetical protein BO94DRAFT_627133 [Aspergillus sclerotioniger CBS 115572]|uniref:Uncharacterized protein n=1 Tax=Aspergillus sclerotioniger CBS 115572 TaxID=1450535 RepID=A0A317VR66_9EURO|nr:hypothetical protein BO94DRAFT_627133 [Aspergillus sclerotioniger CBS 115572]PWY76049.1 hypothetical protein BO94DRAFT_627133 [Aspergillus sclerotioniger CBS 115572]
MTTKVCSVFGILFSFSLLQVRDSGDAFQDGFAIIDPTPEHPPPPSSIRVRPTLLSLTTNNLTYALLGDYSNWWCTYPLPATTPTPYNDPTSWGIVPSWGLATITSSTIPSLHPGTTLWGYWPLSSHEVDLQLIPGTPKDHFIEISPHRQSLMSIYNRYVVLDIKDMDLERQGWESAMRLLWTCGYLLTEYVFSYDLEKKPIMAPFPGTPGLEWGTSEADVSRAVVISLAASGKTARSVAYNLCLRPEGKGPAGLLQVTSEPGVIGEAARGMKPSFQTLAVGYDGVEGAEEWLVERKPEKLVVVDFGGRDGVHQKLFGMIMKNELLRGCKLVVIGVGLQQKVYSMEEVIAGQKAMGELGMINFNTSPVLDAVLEVRDSEKVFEVLSERWNHWLENRQLVAPDLHLVWGKGVVGPEGIEGGWDLLCQSKVKPDEALVYRF